MIDRRSTGLPPVMILGMHRSGTSLLSRLLSQAGFFAGCDLQDDHESVFFIRTNNWILRMARATWDYPERFEEAAKDPQFVAYLANRLQLRLLGHKTGRYTGVKHVHEFCQHHKLSVPWGWKDPRNCFTLPVWRRLYPELKVIHITRHGVDVAQSLVSRERTLLQQAKTLAKASTLCWPRTVQGSIISPFRASNLEGAFLLWEAYLDQARRYVAELGNRACEISYEEFLDQPQPVLERLCQFIGGSFTGCEMHALTANIQRSRAYAYRRDPSLQDFAMNVKERLARHGFPS